MIMKKPILYLLTFFFASALYVEAQEPKGPNILFMIGEREYFTDKSLNAFYQDQLKPLGYRATFIKAVSNEGEGRNDFPGLVEALKKADLLFVSVRRRAPKKAQLEALRQYLDSGKPLIGIRTTSHAFSLRGKPSPEGCEQWETFDPDVIGGNYNGHFGDTSFKVVTGPNKDHPILKGVNLTQSARLYRSAPLKKGTTTLLSSVAEKDQPSEPLAWTNHYGKNKAKIFYTSLGIVEDFKNPEFNKMMVNAVAWATNNQQPTTNN